MVAAGGGDMTRGLRFALSIVLASHGFVVPRDDARQSPAIVEIRSYNLKPGTRDRFHQIFVTAALPMLRRARIDVVAYGPSLHDADSYYLIRAYASLDDRQRSEDAFYGSDEWRKGPREAILACIDSYTTIVLRADGAALRGLLK
jgi:hypothetical protein